VSRFFAISALLACTALASAQQMDGAKMMANLQGWMKKAEPAVHSTVKAARSAAAASEKSLQAAAKAIQKEAADPRWQSRKKVATELWRVRDQINWWALLDPENMDAFAEYTGIPTKELREVVVLPKIRVSKQIGSGILLGSNQGPK